MLPTPVWIIIAIGLVAMIAMVVFPALAPVILVVQVAAQIGVLIGLATLDR